MSDRAYFQALHDTALDFTMKAFYAAAVRQRNNGVLGACQHAVKLPYFDRSYGILYSWEVCQDCGEELNSKRLDGHE